MNQEQDIDPSAQRELELIRAANLNAASLGSAHRLVHAPSDSFPGYDLLGEVHHGGQGDVYHALQRSTRREVAIKVIRAHVFAGPDERARFDREVQILGQLHHPNIVAIHDSGVSNGEFYYVMDYIHGEPLDAYIARLDLTPDAAINLFAKICDAVNAAHLRGVIHRDLKPGNIRIDNDHEPHVLDFGLAKMAAGSTSLFSDSGAMTQTGQFVGSLPWASPEQAESRPEKIDIRSDVYSLGVIAYQMLTHRFPYDVGGPAREVLNRIQSAQPIRPSSISRGINDELETILLKCLSKEPERRYQSAGELSRDVRNYLSGEPIEAKRDSGWYTFKKALSRHRIPFAAATLFALLITVSAIALAVMYGRQGELLGQVQTEAAKAKVVSNFFQDMLERIDPQHARGRDVTVLRELLDSASPRVDRDLAGQPEVQASMHRTIGNAYRSIGEYDRAHAHLQRALEMRLELLRDLHSDVAVSYSDLGGVLTDKADYATAEQMYRKALDIYQQLKGPQHSYVAVTLGNLANLRRVQHDDAEAERLYTQSIDLLRNGGAEDRLDLSKSLDNFAAHLLMRGRYNDAEPVVQESLDIQRDVLSPDHPAVAQAMHNQASLLEAKGDFAGAEKKYLETLELRRRILGADHPTIAETLNNLGHMYQVRGNYAAAEPLFREALAIRRVRLGPNHPDLAMSLHNLSAVLSGKGDLDGAEPLCREAIQIERAQTTARAALSDMLSGLAAVLYFRREYAQAEPLFREALEIRRRLLGESAPTAETMNSLAGVLRIQGNLTEAEALFRDAIAIQRHVLPEAHPSIASGLTGLGALLTQTERAQEALPMLREALEIRRKRLVPNHWLTATSASALGACLTKLGEFDEAEEMLLGAYHLLKKDRGDQHERTIEARDRLIAMYEAWSKPDKAAEYQSENRD